MPVTFTKNEMPVTPTKNVAKSKLDTPSLPF